MPPKHWLILSGIKASTSSTECRICLLKACAVAGRAWICVRVRLLCLPVFGWAGSRKQEDRHHFLSCEALSPTSHVTNAGAVGVVNGGAYKDLKPY